MAKVSVETFVTDFVKELEQQNVAIFAGAGLSVPTGVVDWKGLLKPLVKDLSLDLDREHDLVRVAQYHVNHHGTNRSDLNEAILNGFARRGTQITDNHRTLVRLPIQTYWTTNYDSCIEDALKQGGKVPDIKHSPMHLLTTLRGRNAIVYKMHGDYQDSSNAVLCKDDYETFHIKRGEFLTALAGDLLSKMFLFIGFSFTDPNLDYVLGRLHSQYGEHQRKHYCFVKIEEPKDGDQRGDFEYRKAKQDLFIRDLERYSIRAVMVDTYGEITKILQMVEHRYKSNTIFVSGAAHEYGEHWPEQEVLQFVSNLGKRLIEHEYRLVSGLGLGIGSTVIDGALQQIYHVNRKTLGDQLIIRPFPQSLEGKEMWKAYRQDMLDYAGIAIFLFGNKIIGNPPSLQKSNGMEEEFEIAHSKGIKVLPLGFTGYTALDLYDRVKANFSSYYPTATKDFEGSFALLGDPMISLTEQLKSTMKALNELRGMKV